MWLSQGMLANALAETALSRSPFLVACLLSFVLANVGCESESAHHDRLERAKNQLSNPKNLMPNWFRNTTYIDKKYSFGWVTEGATEQNKLLDLTMWIGFFVSGALGVTLANKYKHILSDPTAAVWHWGDRPETTGIGWKYVIIFGLAGVGILFAVPLIIMIIYIPVQLAVELVKGDGYYIAINFIGFCVYSIYVFISLFIMAYSLIGSRRRPARDKGEMTSVIHNSRPRPHWGVVLRAVILSGGGCYRHWNRLADRRSE